MSEPIISDVLKALITLILVPPSVACLGIAYKLLRARLEDMW